MLTGIIFCDSDSFVAKGIREVTGEPDSHVALLFGDTVLHYRFLGFETMHIFEFMQIYQIHTFLRPKEQILVSIESLVRANKGHAYDFFGMIYVGIFLIMRDIFGIQIPGGNHFEKKRDRFCVEFAAEVCLGERGSMQTPTQFKAHLISLGYQTVEITDEVEWKALTYQS